MFEPAQVEEAADYHATCVDRGDAGHRYEYSPPGLNFYYQANHPGLAVFAQCHHGVADLAELVAAGIEDGYAGETGDENSGWRAHAPRLPASALLTSERLSRRRAVSTLPPQESLPFVIVDVFADRPFAGNPLAVVMDGEALSTAQMGTSHVSSISRKQRSHCAQHRSRRRRAPTTTCGYFSPAVELPFAGHPSVGSAWWLARSAVIATGNVMQLCGEGLLPIEVDSGGAETLPAAQQRCRDRG